MKRAIVVMLFVLMAQVPLFAQQEDSIPAVYSDEYEESDYTDDYETDPLPTVDPTTLPTTKNYQSKELPVKKFDDTKWKEVTGAADYDNERAKKKAKDKSKADSARMNSENEGKRHREEAYDDDDDDESSSFSLGPFGGLIAQVIFYTVVIGIIVLLIYLVLKNTNFKSGNKKIESVEPDIAAPVEDINDLDIDALLQKAEGNYRLAVRLYFLGLLKKLNEVELIVWKKDKTNRDYLTELYNQEQYFDEVKKLTLAYEEVWYGDHLLPAELYHQLRDQFMAIDQRLNASKVQ